MIRKKGIRRIYTVSRCCWEGLSVAALVCNIIYLQQPWNFCGCFVIIEKARVYLICIDWEKAGGKYKTGKEKLVARCFRNAEGGRASREEKTC